MHAPRRTRRAGLVASLVGVAALGLTAATTLGLTSFTAQVGGTGTYQSGTLVLAKQVGSGAPCLSSSNAAGSITTNIDATCPGSDLGSVATGGPGTTATTTVTLTNEGSVAATSGLALTTGACTATGAPDAASPLVPLATGSDTTGFCGKVDVTIEDLTGTVSCLFPAGAGACPAPSNAGGTLATLAAKTTPLAASLAPGASEQLQITTMLDDGATTGATNADQGLVASMPMTYTLAQ
ncbi:MAG: hypothetical protein M0029_06940 [Actinomycetota bacterium]|jgi:hypothetical protein|nr:hypothetical protein [Actinomycetota bacterium]